MNKDIDRYSHLFDDSRYAAERRNKKYIYLSDYGEL